MYLKDKGVDNFWILNLVFGLERVVRVVEWEELEVCLVLLGRVVIIFRILIYILKLNCLIYYWFLNFKYFKSKFFFFKLSRCKLEYWF